MAFEHNNEKLTRSIIDSNKVISDNSKEKEIIIPVFSEDLERTKNYTFSLQPSVRKKLDHLAKEKGYRSSSKLLNSLIKNLE